MRKLERAFYSESLSIFLKTQQAEILGHLAQNNHFELSQEQRSAWLVEINILQRALISLSGHIFFEYAIPRMGKRADVILLINQAIFVVEFKVGSHSFDQHAIDQVTDYALDLKNFHAGSIARPIYPILLATSGATPNHQEVIPNKDNVYSTLFATPNTIKELLVRCISPITYGIFRTFQN